jgi:hypothetical protein
VKFILFTLVSFQKKNDVKNEKNNESQRSTWNDSSLLSDILKENYSKSGILEFFEEDLNVLKKERLKNLGQWKKLSKEQKKSFPVGLINLLDESCSKFLIS